MKPDEQIRTMIEPIGERRQEEVRALTARYLHQAAQRYGLELGEIPVLFDLKGRASGMYVVERGVRRIRYNPWIFSKYYADSLATTVPHEVAHCITDIRYGLANIKPHGAEWRAVMDDLGVEARATSRVDLSGIPQRRQRRFTYLCGCRSHQLSTIRHNKIVRGRVTYRCVECGQVLCMWRSK